MNESNTKNTNRFSIRTLFVLIAIVSVPLALNSAVSGFAISSETSGEIVEGLTQDQILEIAGKPHHTDRDGWYYRVWNGIVPYSDMLFIGFDENGVADWVSY